MVQSVLQAPGVLLFHFSPRRLQPAAELSDLGLLSVLADTRLLPGLLLSLLLLGSLTPKAHVSD